MKHAVISLVVTLLIVGYTVFSFIYIDNFIKTFGADINALNPAGSNNVTYIESAEKFFKSKKNMLLLMISKEHINKIEDCIISLDCAINYDSRQDIENYKILLLNAVEDIHRHNSTIN